ncbi:MAG: pyridoxal-phosphate dependent enzyme [Aeromicrobium sp.]|uniref:1-aminocyclopropane-1-carboxylate deaminase/D-cysteine desulfhydrase n=1 Tax=Aeromicrobium sp. TaxID=1871063 RepID=UPI002628672F|nr:pyridoxal-phosphate dependent enzyme [Aeromicrobium sp.]MDF1705910.1 pyridoxal-phosphate dependent enzyme [Aeromicrobium sp.]
MTLLQEHFPDADLPHVTLGARPTPVRPLPSWGDEVWLKDESAFGDGGWGGNKVRKLEWILPEARRRGSRTLFTVGGIGTHWGLAAALYGAEHGVRTVLGLVEQPIDDHVRDQLRRLDASGAVVHRYPSVRRLKLAAPGLLLRYRDGLRPPYYLPAGGSSPVGTLGYVDAAFELAAQVRAGELPEPAHVVTAVGSAGTAAGLALGLRLSGLSTRVVGVVVNDSFRLDGLVIARLANRTVDLLRDRGAVIDVDLDASDLDVTREYLGETYGATTPEGEVALEAARAEGLELEPVYTAKAFAAARELASHSTGPVLVLNTHGPRRGGA